MQKAQVGIIGGSGLYEIEGIKVLEEVSIDTAWGNPSDKITIGEIGGIRAAFLPRHAKGHRLLPREVNSHANIAALKQLGVSEIIAFSAVGSLKQEIKPRDFVLPSQIIDRTMGRTSTYFGDGIVAHIAFADPFCSRIQDIILPAAHEMGITMHTGETLICMEGPAFSTRAESNMYRSWGAGLINMSVLPEAKLAREAEICYAMVCMSTDYDSWKTDEEHVTLDMIIGNLNANSSNAKNLIKKLIPLMGHERTCGCKEAAKYAIMTGPDHQKKETRQKLKTILPDYF